jgi:hypothetical protein
VAQLGDWLVLLAIQLGEAALHLIHRRKLYCQYIPIYNNQTGKNANLIQSTSLFPQFYAFPLKSQKLSK